MTGFAPSRLVVMTDRTQARRSLADVVAAAVDGGARLAVLREKDLPAAERLVLARRLSAVLGAAGGHLIVAGANPPLGLPGPVCLHLASTDPWPSGPGTRPPDLTGDRAGTAERVDRSRGRAAGGPRGLLSPPGLPPGQGGRAAGGPRGLLGRSCHSDADVMTAASHGADYVTLSPIFASRSKPGYGPPLGTAIFAAEAIAAARRSAAVRVYALGGIENARRAEACVSAGAYGVAVMGAVMRAADPAATVAALLRAVGETEDV